MLEPSAKTFAIFHLNAVVPPFEKGGRGDLIRAEYKIPLGPPFLEGEVERWRVIPKIA